MSHHVEVIVPGRHAAAFATSAHAAGRVLAQLADGAVMPTIGTFSVRMSETTRLPRLGQPFARWRMPVLRGCCDQRDEWRQARTDRAEHTATPRSPVPEQVRNAHGEAGEQHVPQRR
jgi:hypothetical protein